MSQPIWDITVALRSGVTYRYSAPADDPAAEIDRAFERFDARSVSASLQEDGHHAAR